ncbi:response regulator transcription factor [Paenibacillus piscarius]|uniref:response regulator transcription factor n=1 Tax=Paenibacillus piscarius TaxID=1089681 RepID=UPI001EE8742D|nr:response regulator transcription factor [Paenibacillus piscarius]
MIPEAYKDILIVEDDGDISDLVSIYLRNQHFRTRTAGTVQEASRLLAAKRPDLVICDIMLPDGDGRDWVGNWKGSSDIPVIFLSSRKEAEDIISGLELSEDYITKPFDPDVMVARVKASLRRPVVPAAGAEDRERVWSDGRLQLFFDRWQVRLNGEPLNLPAKELQLLLHLAAHPGRVFGVEQLFEKIWGLDSRSDARTVMVHIHQLRRKIEDDSGKARYIETVRGIGYRFLSQ